MLPLNQPAWVALDRYNCLHKSATIEADYAEVGRPPHAYLESVRIRRAQALLEAGQGLARVAAATGFSSQSHFNNRFKHIIGVTPGQYAQQTGRLRPPCPRRNQQRRRQIHKVDASQPCPTICLR